MPSENEAKGSPHPLFDGDRCPLVEHDGLEAEVRWTSVVAKIRQDFSSDIH